MIKVGEGRRVVGFFMVLGMCISDFIGEVELEVMCEVVGIGEVRREGIVGGEGVVGVGVMMGEGRKVEGV